MAKIDNVTLGTVRAMPKSFTRSIRSLYTGDGFSYPQDVNWIERGWNIRGTLNAPSAAVINNVENLNNHSLPVILDLDDKYTDFIQWVVVERFNIAPVLGSLYRYDLHVRKIPCIGTMYIQTTDIYIHSLDYRANYRTVDPTVGSFDKVWGANRRVQTWEFYIDNDKNGAQDAIIEIFGSDDISGFKLWGWHTAAWSLIKDWTGGQWNAIQAWQDEDIVDHNFQAMYGDRGDVLAGIGTISNKLGNKHRVLLEITNLTADATPANDRSTHYGGDQLLLKAEITCAFKETLRPHPIVTYITGGLGPDPA